MKYPKFLKKGDTIGICAPSAGIGKCIDEYIESIGVLKKQGYKIVETKSVRSKKARSASAKTRANEFYELTKNNDVDMIMFATGGDYMFEIMPYVKYDEFVKNPKWLMGMSDPTNILLDVTCFLDVATLYGINGKSYTKDMPNWQANNLEILKGNLIKQKSFKKYQTCFDKWNSINAFNNDVKWLAKNDIDFEGRIIGGCFEVIQCHMGTYLDNMANFISRYADDGIIWFFDVYACTALDFYYGLLKMKYAGLFTNCKAVLIGRVAIPDTSNTSLDYYEAVDLALKDIPHIMDMDIGHTNPCFTIINGSIAHIKYKNNKGEISFKLK